MAEEESGQLTFEEGVTPTEAPVDGPILTDEERLGAMDGMYEAQETTTTPGEETVTEPTPPVDSQATGPSVEELQAQLSDLSDQLANVEKRYGDSSTEAKRLADDLRSRDQLLGNLRETYGLQELESFQPQVDPREKHVTVRDLEEAELRQEWRLARSDFERDNPDFRSAAAMRLLNATMFDEKGGTFDPNKSAADNLGMAQQEALKAIEGWKTIGKQEVAGVRQEITSAAITDTSAPAPDVLPEGDELKVPEGDAFLELHQARQEMIRKGGE